MGNCLFGGLGDEQDLSIKVIKSDGGVLEYFSPSPRAPCPSNSQAMLFFQPLISSGNPCLTTTTTSSPVSHTISCPYCLRRRVEDSCRKLSPKSYSESLPAITPYKMSVDYNHMVLKRSYTSVFSRNIHMRTRQKEKRTMRKRTSKKGGIWKVKLVINTEELLQILSEDGRTNELIESVRVVAKGENVVASSITSGSSKIDLSVVHV